jgi:CRP-like cAMP-binding protein
MNERPFPITSSDSPAIRAIPFFQEFSSTDLSRLLSHTTLVELDPGERLIMEGEQDRSLFFLLQGKLRVMKDGASVAASWGAGEMFGEMAFVHDSVRTATIVAETKVHCLKVAADHIETLSEAERAVYMVALYRYVAITATERLASTTEKLAHCEKQLEDLLQN